MRYLLILLFFPVGQGLQVSAQTQSVIDSFRLYGDVKITLDKPLHFSAKKTIITFFALPNGNSTEQTMGKKMTPGDDWHFDIQHIRAQTAFVRKQIKENFVVIYLENKYRSWPLWKKNHPSFSLEIPHIIDSITSLIPYEHKIIYLNGHSGGGSFIFGYLDGVKVIPATVERISFIDSNYGYDSSYYDKLKYWLIHNKRSTLTVFAYNDSVALYDGKPVVSEKGGTWYKSRLLLRELSEDFVIRNSENDSLLIYESRNHKIGRILAFSSLFRHFISTIRVR